MAGSDDASDEPGFFLERLRARVCQAVQPADGKGLNPSARSNIELLGERYMAGDNTLVFTDAAFDTEVLKSPEPVLVDFWAEWCGPCRQMGPTIDQIATEYAGKAKVGKLDVDSNIQTAGRYQIRGIPTLLVFKDGKVVDQKVGAVGKADVKKMLDAHI